MEDYSKYKGYRDYSKPKRFKEDGYIEFKIGKEPVRFFLTLEAIKLGFTVFLMIVFLSLWAYAFFGMANKFSSVDDEFRRDTHENPQELVQKTSHLDQTMEEEKNLFKLTTTTHLPMDKRGNTTLEVVSMEVEKAN